MSLAGRYTTAPGEHYAHVAHANRYRCPLEPGDSVGLKELVSRLDKIAGRQQPVHRLSVRAVIKHVKLLSNRHRGSLFLGSPNRPAMSRSRCAESPPFRHPALPGWRNSPCLAGDN
ncbi:hypothetical protein p1B270 (plasmid) [Aromatoleum aromaticum EbN1]|uniref:Uncharacterized protein n=1 Tax=Aromatoleum aromaticum (strain DSM 19018 / LMG 30748 / EbN1) TaxID=76114 RepID=Q5NWW0_AROAE|nr:hypothetical protein p1B270 [Aromatoleum aromaticum EbN1]